MKLSFWELENSLLVCELFVHGSECCQLALDVCFVLVLRIQKDLHQLGAINTNSGALPVDFSRANDILHDGFMDTCQGSSTRTDLQTLSSEVLVQNGSVRNKNHMPLRKFLLQFTNQSAMDLFHVLPHSEREIDNHSLLRTLIGPRSNFHLLG